MHGLDLENWAPTLWVLPGLRLTSTTKKTKTLLPSLTWSPLALGGGRAAPFVVFAVTPLSSAIEKNVVLKQP